MSIQSEIDRIKAAKADAKAALIERGVDPGDATIDEYGDQIRAIPTGVTSFNGRTGAVEPQAGDYTAQMEGAAPTSHNHNASAINAGTFPIARGGTGVSAMAGTDYSTNRPRGIILQSSEPSTVANGCIVGVYE